MGLGRSGFVGCADVIVDDHPTAIREAIAVAIDVAPDIGFRVENEEADLTGSDILLQESVLRSFSAASR